MADSLESPRETETISQLCALNGAGEIEMEPEETLRRVMIEIERAIGVALPVSPWCPDGAVLIAEAANAAAKATDDYGPKVAAFVAAAQIPGVRCGWGDNGCWYLAGPLQGPVCAHDPYGEIARHLPARLARVQWPDPWDGRIRQPYAFLRVAGHAKTQRRAVDRAHRVTA